LPVALIAAHEADCGQRGEAAGAIAKAHEKDTTETRSTSTSRVKAFRRRQSWSLHRRLIDVTDAQLDALEVRGYLDPDRRGERADECDAIELFLADSLNKR
jgi:hypothetical protein